MMQIFSPSKPAYTFFRIGWFINGKKLYHQARLRQFRWAGTQLSFRLIPTLSSRIVNFSFFASTGDPFLRDNHLILIIIMNNN